MTVTTTPQDKAAPTAAITAAERKRVTAIMATARTSGYPDELRDKALEDGVAIDAFKAQVLDWKVDTEPGAGQPQFNVLSYDDAVADDRSRISGRGMQDFESPQFVADEKTKHVMSLLRNERPRGKFEGLTDPKAMFTKGSWFRPKASGGMHTAGDFTVASENAANLRLAELMKAAGAGISLVAAPDTFTDFRQQTEVSMSSFPELLEVPEGAEIKHGTITDNGEKWNGASYARAFRISFQAQTNDLFKAIDRSLRDVSVATVQLKSGLLVSALGKTMADTKALFHADHANLAGSGAAISVTTLGTGRAAMRTQKVLGGDAPLGIGPKFLLVPAAQETLAEQSVTAIQAGVMTDANPFAGKLTVAAEARLTGNGWYLFADPAMWPVLKFATLEGFELPRLEFEELFTSLGTSFRVHWHVAATAIDTRGTWKNPGA